MAEEVGWGSQGKNRCVIGGKTIIWPSVATLSLRGFCSVTSLGDSLVKICGTACLHVLVILLLVV